MKIFISKTKKCPFQTIKGRVYAPLSNTPANKIDNTDGLGDVQAWSTVEFRTQ